MISLERRRAKIGKRRSQLRPASDTSLAEKSDGSELASSDSPFNGEDIERARLRKSKEKLKLSKRRSPLQPANAVDYDDWKSENLVEDSTEVVAEWNVADLNSKNSDDSGAEGEYDMSLDLSEQADEDTAQSSSLVIADSGGEITIVDDSEDETETSTEQEQDKSAKEEEEGQNVEVTSSLRSHLLLERMHSRGAFTGVNLVQNQNSLHDKQSIFTDGRLHYSSQR